MNAEPGDGLVAQEAESKGIGHLATDVTCAGRLK
jgi:hypothetical protein